MTKEFIGMIHLQALPTSPNNSKTIGEIIELAHNDLKALESGGATAAIVENFFDQPYTTEITFETFTAYTRVFTELKQKANIPLGVNLHSCSGDEEMVIASICDAEFIRAESFVEARHSLGGILWPMAPKLARKKKELNSKVKIFADINVKESYPFSPQSSTDAINDAIKSNADAIILTGIETGNPPNAEDAKFYKNICKDTKLLIGSGVNKNNIADLLEYADGVIVGSSIKIDGNVNNPVDSNRVKELIESI